MKTSLLSLFLLTQCSFGQESYFFSAASENLTFDIEDESLVIKMPMKRMKPPRASAIIAYHQGLGEGREYKIQVNLSDKAPKGWIPKIKLNDDIIAYGISVSRPDHKEYADSFSLESSDKEQVLRWVAELAKLLRAPADKVQIDLTTNG